MDGVDIAWPILISPRPRASAAAEARSGPVRIRTIDFGNEQVSAGSRRDLFIIWLEFGSSGDWHD
jgi:hypothetical protein